MGSKACSRRTGGRRILESECAWTQPDVIRRSCSNPRVLEVSHLAHIPAKVSALLRELAAQLPVILGRNLFGVYLYGSLTQSAFDPRRSDVDCIVVTRRDMSDAQFRRLGEWLKHSAE